MSQPPANDSPQTPSDGAERPPERPDASQDPRTPAYAPERRTEAPERIHAAPRPGSGVMPCCDRTPFEVPRGERITANQSAATCGTRWTFAPPTDNTKESTA